MSVRGCQRVAKDHEQERGEREPVHDLVALNHRKHFGPLEPARGDDLASVRRCPHAHRIFSVLCPAGGNGPDLLVDDEPILANEEEFISTSHHDSDRWVGEVDGVIGRGGAVGIGDLLQEHAEPRVPGQRIQQLDFPSVPTVAHGGPSACDSTSITTMRSSSSAMFLSPCIPPGRLRTTSPGPTSNCSPSRNMRPLPDTITYSSSLSEACV